MVTRLVTHVLRRFGGMYWIVFVLLTLWLVAGELPAGLASGEPGAQRARYAHLGAITIAMLLSPVAGYRVAFGALNNRVVRMLPVSRRDLWRATWMLATLGAATLTMAAQALTMVIWRAIAPAVIWHATAPAASNAFTQLVVTWSSTFILGGVLLAVGVRVPRLPPATGVFRNLLTPVVWFLRYQLTVFVHLLLAVAFIMGAIRLPGLLLRYVTMDWSDMSGWSSIATALALLVAIASYWHRPRVNARAGRPPQARTGWSRATLIPRGTLSAIRLLVFEHVVSACLTAAVVLGVVTALMTALMTARQMTARQPFGEAVAVIAPSFNEAVAAIAPSFGAAVAAIASSFGDPSGSPILFGAFLGVTICFADRFNARHLRALPVSTLQLTGLLLLPALLFRVAAITIVSGAHLAVIGTLPRIDASLLAPALGITALCQPLWLQSRRPHVRLFACMAIIPVAWVPIWRPDVLAPLTHPITFGVLLTAIAIAWSYWLLTRSSTPFSATTIDRAIAGDQ